MVEVNIFYYSFCAFRAQRPEAETGCIYEWDGIKYLIDTTAVNYHAIIVTSDHGGIETDHSGWDLNELETPFIIAGKNVKKGGKFSESMMQYDVAATIAEIFALDTPQVWTSKSMSQVFE